MCVGSVEYIIADIDYWEQDADLYIGGHRFYFQFSKEAGPTLEEALKFIKSENKYTL